MHNRTDESRGKYTKVQTKSVDGLRLSCAEFAHRKCCLEHGAFETTFIITAVHDILSVYENIKIWKNQKIPHAPPGNYLRKHIRSSGSSLISFYYSWFYSDVWYRVHVLQWTMIKQDVLLRQSFCIWVTGKLMCSLSPSLPNTTATSAKSIKLNPIVQILCYALSRHCKITQYSMFLYCKRAISSLDRQ